jgi:hypothetical protein
MIVEPRADEADLTLRMSPREVAAVVTVLAWVLHARAPVPRFEDLAYVRAICAQLAPVLTPAS